MNKHKNIHNFFFPRPYRSTLSANIFIGTRASIAFRITLYYHKFFVVLKTKYLIYKENIFRKRTQSLFFYLLTSPRVLRDRFGIGPTASYYLI